MQGYYQNFIYRQFSYEKEVIKPGQRRVIVCAIGIF